MMGAEVSLFKEKLKQNAFQHFYPEQQLCPSDVVELFVKEYTEYNALTSYTHTFVFGGRGSGKTILFKFLEPACRSVEYPDFFDQPEACIGIYVNYNTGDYTRVEFQSLLKDQEVPIDLSRRIIMHYFIMDICDSVVETLIQQLSDRIETTKEKEASGRIISVLDRKGIHGDIPESQVNLKTLKRMLNEEKSKVLLSIQDYQQNYGTPGNRLDYTANFTDPSCRSGSFLYIFFNELRRVVGLDNIPFFLLFDEVTVTEKLEALIEFHQQIINTFVSQRIQNLVCIKVSACPESYIADEDISGRRIEPIHDYYTIDLDSLYTNNKQSYYRRIREIANKRFQIAGWAVKDIEEFLPENPTEQSKMEQAIEYTADEYDKLPEKDKIESKQNYINKYARARFFQKFLKKTEYGYTGFDNLVHFSSGVTRAFLDVCFHMVVEYKEEHPYTNVWDIDSIPFKIQSKAVKLYSNSLIETKLLQPILRRAPDSDRRQLLQELFNLIEALGGAFKSRLDNESSRYPRVISFSLKETVREAKLERVLQEALRECIFHKKWYRAKSGYEMFECFILNRRLCPRYKLDLSGFQGRVEFSQGELLPALDDPKRFTTWFRAREKTAVKEEDEQLALFDV